MNTPARKPAAGFTLLEILVALIIFALLSIMTYRGLTTVIQTRTHLAQENRKWRAVAMLFARMEQDLSMLAKRPVRDVSDLTVPPFVAKPIAQGEQDAQLMFTRMGFPEQTNALAGPLRCGYRLRGDVIEQVLWPAPDSAPRAVPVINTLLENVATVEFQYLDSAGAWHTRWPLPGNKLVFPAAVQIVLELKSKERVTRLFALPALQQ
jgi:general secretion pathway protein J